MFRNRRSSMSRATRGSSRSRMVGGRRSTSSCSSREAMRDVSLRNFAVVIRSSARDVVPRLVAPGRKGQPFEVQFDPRDEQVRVPEPQVDKRRIAFPEGHDELDVHLRRKRLHRFVHDADSGGIP